MLLRAARMRYINITNPSYRPGGNQSQFLDPDEDINKLKDRIKR